MKKFIILHLILSPSLLISISSKLNPVTKAIVHTSKRTIVTDSHIVLNIAQAAILGLNTYGFITSPNIESKIGHFAAGLTTIIPLLTGEPVFLIPSTIATGTCFALDSKKRAELATKSEIQKKIIKDANLIDQKIINSDLQQVLKTQYIKDSNYKELRKFYTPQKSIKTKL